MHIKLPLLVIILPTAIVLSISMSLSAYHDNFVFGQFSNTSGTNTSSSNSESGGLTSTDSEENAADVVILSQKLKKEDSGYRNLVGQVKNAGTGIASSIVVRLTVYDKDGGVVGSDYTDADRDTLPAGQKSTYSFSTETQNFDGMDHYDLSLEWVNPDSSQGYKDIAVTYKLTDSESKGDSDSKSDSKDKDDSK